jgi:hypothetical protein
VSGGVGAVIGGGAEVAVGAAVEGAVGASEGSIAGISDIGAIIGSRGSIAGSVGSFIGTAAEGGSNAGSFSNAVLGAVASGALNIRITVVENAGTSSRDLGPALASSTFVNTTQARYENWGYAMFTTGVAPGGGVTLFDLMANRNLLDPLV